MAIVSKYAAVSLTIQLLKHIIRDKDVYDRYRKFCKKDTSIFAHGSGAVVDRLYQNVADVVIAIDDTPISRSTLEVELQERVFNSGHMFDVDKLNELLDMIYAEDLNPGWMLKELKPMISHRKQDAKIKELTALGKFDDLAVSLAETKKELDSVDVENKIVSLSPFEVLIETENYVGIPTGFECIDAKIGGLGYGECALLLGASGAGKTAVATNIALNPVATGGYKVLYISAEEPAKNVSNRVYANKFDLNYTELHQGKIEMEKAQCFKNLDPADRKKLANLRIVDVRDITPLTADAIFAVIEQHAAEGFIPQLVVVDQLDYVKPVNDEKKDAAWEKYGIVSFELDAMSHKKILGEHSFALWVLHQLKGSVKWRYTVDDIASFRGIIKPFDLAFAVGRTTTDPNAQDFGLVNFHSIKTRNVGAFEFTYVADFPKMRFTPRKEGRYEPEENKPARRVNSGGNRGNPINNGIPIVPQQPLPAGEREAFLS